MRGKINAKGFLSIDGRGNLYCPFNVDAYCGHWCPLFGEPRILTNGEARLPICQGRELFFEVNGLTDERTKP